MLNIRGVEHPIVNVSDTVLVPLYRIFPTLAFEAGEESERVIELALQALGNPSNHEQLAFVIKSAIPSIPDSIVRYNMYLLPDGRKHIEFAPFCLDMNEIKEIIFAIMAEREKAPQQEPKTEAPPEAIASSTQAEQQKVKLERKAARIAELREQIALLESASN